MNRHRRMLALLALTCVGSAGILTADAPPAARAVPSPDRPATPGVSPEPMRTEVDPVAADPVVERRTAHPAVLLENSDQLGDDAVWLPGQVMVRATSRAALGALADALEARVVHSGAVDGLGVLVLPEGMDEGAAMARLDGHPDVAGLRRHGLVRASQDATDARAWTAEEPPDFRTLQWHRAAVGTALSRASPRTWVAVLDTGMAFADGVARTAQSGRQVFRAAQTLSNTPLVDPWDFVFETAYPVDEHQHGTHITSLIASAGTVEGMAPGVAILPYRVLDAWSQGTELGLIDALYAAVWADADVVNLSLSFGATYEPSSELLEALGYVDDAGLVMVAAAGNHAGVGSTWPAASPRVISVAASCLDGDGLGPAPYSNRGGDVDLLAPGGCIDRDMNQDGHPDGILGETFVLNQPDRLGWFWFEGTSQAAAITTGVVARLLEAGVPADQMRTVLQAGAVPVDDDLVGFGVGHLSLQGSQSVWSRLGRRSSGVATFGVVLTPWLRDDGGTVSPAARILVVDASGHPAHGVTVTGHFRGTTQATFTCVTDHGSCDVVGEPSDVGDAGWTVTVGAAGRGAVRLPPFRLGLVDPASAELLDATAEHLTGLDGFADGAGPMGWFDPGTDQPGLGTTAPSLTFVGGSGIQTSPFGVILSPDLVETLGTTETELVGSGIQTSPFGLLSITLDSGDTLFGIEGSGIQTSPFGVLPPAPGLPSCIGESTCPETLVLDTGGTVGQVGDSAASHGMGASPAVGLLGASVAAETLGVEPGLAAMMHQAVPLDGGATAP